MSDQQLLEAFSHALKAVGALPEEGERKHFKELLSQGLFGFLSAIEEYAMSKAVMHAIQMEMHNKNPN